MKIRFFWCLMLVQTGKTNLLTWTYFFFSIHYVFIWEITTNGLDVVRVVLSWNLGKNWKSNWRIRKALSERPLTMPQENYVRATENSELETALKYLENKAVGDKSFMCGRVRYDLKEEIKVVVCVCLSIYLSIYLSIISLYPRASIQIIEHGQRKMNLC